MIINKKRRKSRSIVVGRWVYIDSDGVPCAPITTTPAETARLGRVPTAVVGGGGGCGSRQRRRTPPSSRLGGQRRRRHSAHASAADAVRSRASGCRRMMDWIGSGALFRSLPLLQLLFATDDGTTAAVHNAAAAVAGVVLHRFTATAVLIGPS